MGFLSKIILVTGINGWLGKSFINIASNNGKNYELVGLSSSDKIQIIFNAQNNKIKVPIKNFWNSNNLSGEVEGLVHLAFLTRDKLKNMSSSEYLYKNRQITQRACSLILDHKPNWVLTVSSGATQNSDEANFYGQLKLEEENALNNACESSGSTLVIGRLWGATGFLMPINRNYAISDFICQGLETGKINVNSRYEVWRRYVDADQFMHLLYSKALVGDSVIINSGGPKIEIGDLAKKIAFNLGIKDQVFRNLETDSQLIDDYFFSGNEYEIAMDKIGIIAKGIDEQVSDTILGHKLQTQTKEG